jgi:hypothetical protein
MLWRKIAGYLFLVGNLFYSNLINADAVNQVSITNDNQYRYIKSNGIPYQHGQFPNQHDPNSLLAQKYNFRMPLKPSLSGYITQLQPYMDFGVGLDGVPFDPDTAEFWHGDPNWRYEAMSGKINLGLDANDAHTQPNGAYHYHGVPTELIGKQDGQQHSVLVGYAADGFPIYAIYGYVQASNPNSGIKALKSSYQIRKGTRPSGPGGTYDGSFTADYVYVDGAGDLDQCNGRYGVTPQYPEGTYAYFITREFPMIGRCFKGTPDPSFIKQGGRGSGMGGRGGMGQGMPPR